MYVGAGFMPARSIKTFRAGIKPAPTFDEKNISYNFSLVLRRPFQHQTIPQKTSSSRSTLLFLVSRKLEWRLRRGKISSSNHAFAGQISK